MTWVWENSVSSGAARLVLLAIADAANDAGREAYPGMARIAAKANLDKRTAQRAIRTLVEIGELTVHPNAGPNGTHRYVVRMETGGRQDATPASHHPGTLPPRQDATVASDPAGGGISSLKGRQDATRNILNPSSNHPSSSNDQRDKPLVKSTDARFTEFWDVYPKRVAKAAALKALAKVLAAGTPLEDVVKGAIRYRDDPRRSPEYTAHASTWLNAGRWDDETTVTPNGAPRRSAGWEFGMD